VMVSLSTAPVRRSVAAGCLPMTLAQAWKTFGGAHLGVTYYYLLCAVLCAVIMTMTINRMIIAVRWWM